MTADSDRWDEAAPVGDLAKEADDFRLVAPSGAKVVRPDRLDARSRFRAMVPSLFTLTNMMLGYSSMRASLSGNLRVAAVLIAFAVLCDIFDGGHRGGSFLRRRAGGGASGAGTRGGRSG